MASKFQRAKAQAILDIENIMGFKPDRWGHYKFTKPTGMKCRIKTQKLNMRLEIKSSAGWVRVHSLSYTADQNQLRAWALGGTQ